MALNCDGAVAIDSGVASCSGIIHDSEGNFKLIKDGCPKEHQSFQLVQDIHRMDNDEGTMMLN